jgi:hypothetical protein
MTTITNDTIAPKTTHSLPETLEKVQKVAQRLGANRAKIDDLKQTVVKKYIEEFCSELYPHPKGYPAPRGGYWFVQAPDLIKISYKTGLIFNLETPERYPMMGSKTGRRMDIIDLWMHRYKVTFEQAVRDITAWVDHREKGLIKPKVRTRSVAYYDNFKQLFFRGVFEKREVNKERGSARLFWKILKKELPRILWEEWEEHRDWWDLTCQEFPELLSAP